MLSSGAICMLLLRRQDQRLLSPSGTNQQTSGNTSGTVCFVQRNSKVRHSTQTRLATHGQLPAALSSAGCKGPCFPNCQRASLVLAKTLRGIMMTHEKQQQHNLQKLFGKSSAAGSCASSMECTGIHGDLPVHQEQPQSLSRLFC